MKIILREHVDHLGERGDIVSVASGFARNYLLPKGYAYEATPGNLKQIEHKRRAWAAVEGREVAAAQDVAGQLAAATLTLTKKAGESGTLYGSVTNAEVAELLARRGLDIDRRRIVLEEPIKSLGEHEVKVKLHKKVTAQRPAKTCFRHMGPSFSDNVSSGLIKCSLWSKGRYR